MSATENGAEAPGTRAYFQAIETLFIELRGAPLLLSPADWKVAKGWYEEGIPLELVERTLREIFARREERGTADKVRTLRFCRKAVEKAWREHRELQAPAARREAPAFELEPRLDALSRALPEKLPGRAELAERILALEGGPAEVEDELAEIDRELLERAGETLSGERRQELEDRLDRALEGLARRLPREELERARERLRSELLRELAELPVVSLFSPAAEAGG